MKLGSFSGGGLGFGVAFTLEDQFSWVADQINSKFESLSASVEETANKINNQFGKLYAGAALVATGLALLAPLGIGVKLAAEFEATNVAFETMLGSAETAKRIMSEISDVAVKTPFQLPQVEQGYKRLMAFGVGVNELKMDFMSLGNIAAGTGADLNNLIRAYGQVKGKGTLKGQEFMQFTEQGFDLGQALRNIGVDFDQTKKDVGEMKIPFDKVREAVLAAAGAGGQFDNLMNKLAGTVSGKWSNAVDLFTRSMRRVGQILEAVTKPALNAILFVLEAIEGFIQTNIGKWVVGIFAFTLALVAMGIVVVGLKMIWIALGGIISVVLGEVLLMIAPLVILAAQLYILYRLLNSTNPVLVAFGVGLAIAFGPIGWIVGAVILLKRAWSSFTDMMEQKSGPAKGWLGILQQIGGFMQGIVAIFQSATSSGFTMSEQMTNSLARLNILDDVVALGTWIVRIKEFLRGMRDGFVEAWGVIKSGFKAVWDRMVQVGEGLGLIDSTLMKNKSNLETWRKYGVWAAYGIVAVVGVLTLAFISLAIAVVAAFWPVLLTIAAVALGVWLLAEAVGWLNDNWDLMAQLAGQAWDAVKEGASAVWQWLTDLPSRVYQTGVDFVHSLLEGVKSVWSEFTTWFSDAWEQLTSGISNFFGLGDDEANVNMNKNTNFNNNLMYGNPALQLAPMGLDGIGQNIAYNNAQRTVAPASVNTTSNNEVVKNITFKVELDGDEITTKITDKQELKEARR